MIKLILLMFSMTFTSVYAHHDAPSETRESVLKKSIIRILHASIPTSGTAFSVEYKGKVFTITNAHVCDPVKKDFMVYKKDKKFYKVKVIRVSKYHDICVLGKIPHLKPLKIRSNISAEEHVYTMGYPLTQYSVFQEGIYKGLLFNQMKYPEQSAKLCKSRDYLDIEYDVRGNFCVLSGIFMVTTLTIDAGASGSPVINSNGEVVGIISLSIGNMSMGLAVPSNYLVKTLEELI